MNALTEAYAQAVHYAHEGCAIAFVPAVDDEDGEPCLFLNVVWHGAPLERLFRGHFGRNPSPFVRPCVALQAIENARVCAGEPV